ncbi:MAG: putative toxin-antitoxin system toxin component, PIN family [Deltaproteobacteria bacterium]|nr:putative toxin-antitoxin system toxin component, PIN family [Deltaproteobacteria bacterium]
MTTLSVVLDTQQLLRGATARRLTLSRKIYLAWLAGRYQLLLSKDILAEIAAVLSEPLVVRRLKITEAIFEHTLLSLQARCRWVEVKSKIRACRDPSDDKFLECAVDGQDSYLVSADQDLLALGTFEGIEIIDAPTFWRKLDEQ